MSEFSAHWLASREAADHRARDHALLLRVVDYFQYQQRVELGVMTFLDVGCGTGSNLRAMAPFFGERQRWILLDYDINLLAKARKDLILWADQHVSAETFLDSPTQPRLIPSLNLQKEGKQITVDFRREDLAQNLEAVMNIPADLITASAFFDLVAKDWLSRFCQILTKPLYTVLTYDGREDWRPENALDTLIRDAFHHHQQTDKGFGAALGPSATSFLQTHLEKRGLRVFGAHSPWILSGHDHVLIQQLAQGISQAVRETELVDSANIDAWEASRSQAQSCVIGHQDIFAVRISSP